MDDMVIVMVTGALMAALAKPGSPIEVVFPVKVGNKLRVRFPGLTESTYVITIEPDDSEA